MCRGREDACVRGGGGDCESGGGEGGHNATFATMKTSGEQTISVRC